MISSALALEPRRCEEDRRDAKSLWNGKRSMNFISLTEKPELTHDLIQNMEQNSDWHEIIPWLREMTASCGNDTLPIIRLAFDGEDMIGFLVIAEKELLKDDLPYKLWLGILMVFDRFRGRGYSPAMIEEACRITAKAGYAALYLATDHIRYYERFGFEEIGLATYQWNAPTKLYRRFI